MHWKEHDTDNRYIWVILIRTCAAHGIVVEGAGVGAFLLLLGLDGRRDGGKKELPALASASPLISNLGIMWMVSL